MDAGARPRKKHLHRKAPDGPSAIPLHQPGSQCVSWVLLGEKQLATKIVSCIRAIHEQACAMAAWGDGEGEEEIFTKPVATPEEKLTPEQEEARRRYKKRRPEKHNRATRNIAFSRR